MHSSVLFTFMVVQTFHLGGTGGFDYLTVDSENGLLYVPRTTHTMVVNAQTGKLVADIPGQKGNHGVAIVHSAGRGFISDGRDGSVMIFDLKSNKALGKIKADDDADGIIYDRSSNKVLLVCGDAGKLIPISPDVDPESGKADPAIDLGGKPEFLAADKDRIYINLVDKDQVAVVDSKTMKVVDKWTTKPGGSPVGMAIDPAKHRLYIGCRNPQKMIVMSTENGKVLADLPIGAGVDATAFFDGYALASCRDGTLAVAAETKKVGHFEIVQTVTTKPGAKTMGVDPKTKSVYLPTAEFQSTGGGGRPAAKPDSFMIVVVRPKIGAE
jgi:DNA-binding beta-propeller fold protein YncE